MDEPLQSPAPAPAPYTTPVTPAPAAVAPPESSNAGKVLAIIAAVVVLAAAIYYFVGRSSGEVAIVSPSPSESVLPSETPSPTASTSSTPLVTGKSTLESLDATWNLYTNTALGFSIKVPKLFYRGSVPTITESGNTVTIGEWKIMTGKVSSAANISDFLKTTDWWAKCEVDTIADVPGKDYQSVTLKRTLPDGACFTNYVYTIFYSPTKQNVAGWALGQDVQFSGMNGAPAYDQDMVESFKFTQ